MPDPLPESQPPYRLDELGWLQFDRLCSLLLEAEAGVGELSWRGQSDSWRVATVQDPLILHGSSVRLSGPVTVVALWIPAAAPPGARSADLAARLAEVFRFSDLISDRLLVLTNLHTEQIGSVLRAQAFVAHRELTVIGAPEIGQSLDRHPELRLALPSVLGLRDLTPLLALDVLSRSRFDLAGANELARVFWPTRAYEQARAVLDRHRFVVLTGPPEMGKTAIAQMLALAQLTDGWEIHECTDPDQVQRAFALERRQLFVADDAFGSTEYRPDSAERWALGLGRLLAMLDADHRLIWTSRPAPLKAGLRRVQRERHAERFPSPGQVLVDASDLDLQEKTLILYRHAKAGGVAGPARALLLQAGLSIVEHPHFTPERIRRFVTDRVLELTDPAAARDALLRAVERELASPTEAMRNSFNALEPEHRDLLVSLLDAPAGLIDERELTAAVRRHHSGGLSRSPGDLIDRLTDHFLRVTPLGIGWVHPSWRDLVIEQLRADAAARQRFLAVCGVSGVTLALSQEGGGTGERQLPLLVEDADWDRLGDRIRELLHHLEPREVSRLLLAIESALIYSRDTRQRRELRSLGGHALEATRRLWDHSNQALAAFTLDAWYRLNDQIPEDIDSPRLSTTWVELHPGPALREHPDRDELLRADEWLAVAQVLREHDIAALQALGFFGRDRDLLEGFIANLPRLASADPEARPLAEGVLRRIGELVPELAQRARSAYVLADARDPELERWWVPHDIAAPPSTEPVAARSEFTFRDVDRVLRDL